MKLGIDGNLMCGKKTGMGVVVTEILKRWVIKDTDISVIIYAPGDIEEEEIFNKNGIIVKHFNTFNYFRWEQIILPRIVNEDNIDILWCPYNTSPKKIRCQLIITIHDVIYLENSIFSAPSLYKKLGIVYRRLFVLHGARKAKKILTVSEEAKRRIISRIPEIENKIIVVNNGINQEEKLLSEGDERIFFSKNGIAGKFFLGFGSLEQRKNTIGLIKAYQMLPSEIQKTYQLVLFGFRGYCDSYEKRYIEENGIQDKIIVLDYISEEEKGSLYKKSSAFIFPSFSEGFGIPILEGFKYNVPVITSNCSSMPEVGGDAAVYVDPYDSKDICDGMKRIISNDMLRNTLIEKGKTRVKEFDWEKSSLLVKDLITKMSV